MKAQKWFYDRHSRQHYLADEDGEEAAIASVKQRDLIIMRDPRTGRRWRSAAQARDWLIEVSRTGKKRKKNSDGYKLIPQPPAERL